VLDLSERITAAKLGRTRKEAQVDTCTVFAAALYDVLASQGIPCHMVSVYRKEGNHWGHLVVAAFGRMYDSLGEFSTDIYRARAKVHPAVALDLVYEKDVRSDCYESDFEDLYAFYFKALRKSICAPREALAACPVPIGYNTLCVLVKTWKTSA
jgi:hypothetical protein